MRTRGLLVLVIGLFLAGGSVLVAHSYLQKMTARPGEAQAKEVTAIVVARGEIQYGARSTSRCCACRMADGSHPARGFHLARGGPRHERPGPVGRGARWLRVSPSCAARSRIR